MSRYSVNALRLLYISFTGYNIRSQGVFPNGLVQRDPSIAPKQNMTIHRLPEENQRLD